MLDGALDAGLAVGVGLAAVATALGVGRGCCNGDSYDGEGGDDGQPLKDFLVPEMKLILKPDILFFLKTNINDCSCKWILLYLWKWRVASRLDLQTLNSY